MSRHLNVTRINCAQGAIASEFHLGILMVKVYICSYIFQIKEVLKMSDPVFFVFYGFPIEFRDIM